MHEAARALNLPNFNIIRNYILRNQQKPYKGKYTFKKSYKLLMENSLKKSKSYIYNALLKYGHSNFELTILEYCSPEQCLEREDYYLCSFPHEYNILPKAGSRLYSKCSDKKKQIMSDAQKGKTLSDDTKQKISDAMTGEKHPRYNKSRPEGAGSPSQAIEVTDSELNKTTTYNSISEAAIALNLTSYRIISNYIKNNQKKPYKGRYTFKRAPKN
jgi:group I intron endonuclease